MATGSDIRVEGLSRAVRDLARLGVDLEDLRAAFSRIAAEAVPTYQRFTPRRSGRLRGDYRMGRTANRVVLYVGRASVPYAAAINYGWGSSASSWKHGRRSVARAGLLRGTFAGADFVARGDAVETPRALTAIEADIDRLIRARNLS